MMRSDLFAAEYRFYGFIYRRIGEKMVIVQIFELRIHSIDPAASLDRYLVRIVERIEYHGVGLCTVPAFGPG